MPQPVLGPAIDTFDRANEDPLSFAGRWDTTNPPLLTYEYFLRLFSNEAIGRNQGAGAANRGSTWNEVWPAGDKTVWGELGLGNAGNSEPGVGILLELQNPGTAGVDGYIARTQNGINVVNFIIARIDNGGQTIIDQTGNISDANEPANGDALVFQRIAGQLEFWIRKSGVWTMRCDSADSTYDGGQFGLNVGTDDMTWTGVFGGPPRTSAPQIMRYV